MIELRDISLRFDHHRALDQVGFVLPARAFAVIRGASGAGKSSLLRLLASFEKPSQGDILVGGGSICRLSRRGRAHYRRSLGYTGADVGLLEQRSCFENVALPLRVTGLRESDVRARVTAALAKVGLARVSALMPNELSGGEQQRLQIARAIVNRPSILLADEPTAQLDTDSAQLVIELFSEFNRAGVTVLIATHSPEQFPMATHQMYLVQGRLDKLTHTPPAAALLAEAV
ncbi:MAG: cell division ATP-binding protein FtsE [Burkholderiaceae bacterium]|jgi:cell division transport system ATP-binding protein